MVACVALSCTKDKNKVTKSTYVYYSLNGATCNGEYTVEDDNDPLTLNGEAIIVPGSNGDPDIVIMTITDYINDREVVFQLPAKKGGPYVVTYNDEFFGMAIYDNPQEWVLVSGEENTLNGVSFDITKFEKGPGFLGIESVTQMEGNFEGIMTYENDMGEKEIHTVKGDFFFNGTF